jgi:hypothetical protein
VGGDWLDSSAVLQQVRLPVCEPFGIVTSAAPANRILRGWSTDRLEWALRFRHERFSGCGCVSCDGPDASVFSTECVLSKDEPLLDGQACQFPCAQKDAGEHGAVQAAGIGIAQGWVVRGQKVKVVGEKVIRSVAEAVGRFAGDDASMQKVREVAVEGDLSETDDDADAWERLDFAGEVGGAVANLLRLRLVTGRGATDDRGDPGVAEFEAVVAVDCAGLAGEAELVQDGVHEVTGAIACERTAGAVGSVGAWREAEDEDAGVWVAEAGNRARPIGLVEVGAAFGLADALTVSPETRAEVAGDDRFANLL